MNHERRVMIGLRVTKIDHVDEKQTQTGRDGEDIYWHLRKQIRFINGSQLAKMKKSIPDMSLP